MPTLRPIFQDVAQRLAASQTFGSIDFDDRGLSAAAVGAGGEARYGLLLDGDCLWVALQTPERYLSQSIEADLMHTGDKLEELLEEELVDLGFRGAAPGVEHFRDEAKLYTFRSKTPIDPARPDASLAVLFVRAYEACFRNLGDMNTGEEE